MNAVIDGGAEQPDLLCHIPGLPDYDATVVEVKSAGRWQPAGVRKDLETLGKLVTARDRWYHEGSLAAIWQRRRPHGLVKKRILDAAAVAFKDVGLTAEQRRRIRVILHSHVRENAQDLGTLEGILNGLKA